MNIGNKIAHLRKENGMTQEQLASMLQVSNQAVSKWEASQCYPDITLFPQLADIFKISIDSLFDREGTATITETEKRMYTGLPWENDGQLRAVLYVGQELICESKIKEEDKFSQITFQYEGPALDVYSVFSIQCGDVEGNVRGGGNISCGNIEGNAYAEKNISCGNVGGDIYPGTNKE